MTRDEAIAHLDKKREQNRCWQQRNREKVRATNREWAAANREVGRAGSAKHYAKCKQDPEKMKERAHKTKLWRKANPEKHCAQVCRWQAKNPQKVVVIQAQRRARQLKAKGKFTNADIERLMRLQGRKCALAWCRKPIGKKKHVDHVMPLALGGSNEPTNLQLLCHPCNHRKWAKHPIDFAQQNGMLL